MNMIFCNYVYVCCVVDSFEFCWGCVLGFCEIRCREKQRKESFRLQGVNRKLTAMNKLLMEENDRLQKQVSHLVYENGYFRQNTQNVRFLLFQDVYFRILMWFFRNTGYFFLL